MPSELNSLPLRDLRRPQRGDEVQYATGGYCGRVGQTHPMMFKVNTGSDPLWLIIDSVQSRSLGFVTLRCDERDRDNFVVSPAR